MRRAASATVVSGETVTKSVVITDLARIVMCTLQLEDHARYRTRLVGRLDVSQRAMAWLPALRALILADLTCKVQICQLWRCGRNVRLRSCL